MGRSRKKQPQSKKHQAGERKEEQRRGHAPALHEQVGDTDGPAQRQAQQERAVNPPERRLRQLEVSFTGAVALFALIQACVSCWQWQSLRQANELATRNAELSQRAWVVAQSFQIVKLPTTSAEGLIIVTLKNVGNSPARIRYASNAFYSPSPIAKSAAVVPQNQPTTEGTIGPGGEVPVRSVLERIREDRASEIANGTLHLHIVGRISYDDQFEVPRETTVCRHLSDGILTACPLGFERFR